MADTQPDLRPDVLGWRAKIAVVAPSTNTIVQPDMEGFRPPGVTNQHGRILVPNMPIASDADFSLLVEKLAAEFDDAVDRCMTCAPDHLIVAISALTFWGGRRASEDRIETLRQRIGVGVSAGSFACEAALRAVGARRIAIISPYFPVLNTQVQQFFAGCGFEVAAFHGLRCSSPLAIAQVTPAALRAVVQDIDHDGIDAFLQIGTNLSACGLFAALSEELSKPMIANNAATYWHALRVLGIIDRFESHGPLFERW